MGIQITLAIQIATYLITIGVLYGTIATRLKYIEKKLDKHNNFIERVYCLEKLQGEHEIRLEHLEQYKEG